MYDSLAPKSTLLARFCTILAISSRPRRISLEGVVIMRPSASGATIAGQKNRRKMNAPTAVNLASGNRVMTEEEIYGDNSQTRLQWQKDIKTHNTTNLPE
jgi:hypothetical protein